MIGKTRRPNGQRSIDVALSLSPIALSGPKGNAASHISDVAASGRQGGWFIGLAASVHLSIGRVCQKGDGIGFKSVS